MLQNLKERLFGKSEEDRLIENIYVIMKEFGYTLNEIKNMPIPTFKILLSLLEKEYREMNKKMKR